MLLQLSVNSNLEPRKGLLFGPDAPLQLLADCLAMLAACAIPTILIGLGATLAYGEWELAFCTDCFGSRLRGKWFLPLTSLLPQQSIQKTYFH